MLSRVNNFIGLRDWAQPFFLNPLLFYSITLRKSNQLNEHFRQNWFASYFLFIHDHLIIMWSPAVNNNCCNEFYWRPVYIAASTVQGRLSHFLYKILSSVVATIISPLSFMYFKSPMGSLLFVFALTYFQKCLAISFWLNLSVCLALFLTILRYSCNVSNN